MSDESCKWPGCDEPVKPSKGNRPTVWCVNPEHNAVRFKRLEDKVGDQLTQEQVAAHEAATTARESVAAQQAIPTLINRWLDARGRWEKLDRSITDDLTKHVLTAANPASIDAERADMRSKTTAAVAAKEAAEAKAEAEQQGRAAAEERAAATQANADQQVTAAQSERDAAEVKATTAASQAAEADQRADTAEQSRREAEQATQKAMEQLAAATASNHALTEQIEALKAERDAAHQRAQTAEQRVDQALADIRSLLQQQ